MITVEVDGVPELSCEDWREVARACQYAADRLWKHDTRRPAWLRLRNVALEAASIAEIAGMVKAGGWARMRATPLGMMPADIVERNHDAKPKSA